jgi:hypothetical protein
MLFWVPETSLLLILIQLLEKALRWSMVSLFSPAVEVVVVEAVAAVVAADLHCLRLAL